MPLNAEIDFFEIFQGMVPTPDPKMVGALRYHEEDTGFDWTEHHLIDTGLLIPYQPSSDPSFLVTRRLQWLDARRNHLRLWGTSGDEEVRTFTIPVVEAFHDAARVYPQISVDPDIMAGAPCVQGTRIPVYMILDAVESYGSLEGALRSYPRLTLDQVKEAIGFAKLVVECPVEHENTAAG